MTVRHLSIVGLGLLAWAACVPEGGAGDDPGAEAGDERFWAQSMLGMGTLSEVTNFGNNPGGLRAYKYVPDNMPANAPMVLALHPCSLNASDYRRVGWERLADQLKFYVLYPEQQTNNNALRCFNWAGEFGDPTNLRRGEGENQSFKQIIDKMKADHSIDASRVFIMGHSGGGAQTALMMATWPELFAAGGIIAGVPYDCTRNFNQVSTCLSPGLDKSPQTHGDLVRAAVPNFAGTYPRVTIWHGASDTTVVTMNQRELMEQWTSAHGIDQTGDATSMVDGATRTEYKDAQGRTRVETITIPSFGHGTPVKPAEMCGTAGSFTLNANICAVQRMAEFFGLDGGAMPGDTTAPTVNITAPANDATVSGLVTVTVDATDDVRVGQVLMFAKDASGAETLLGTDFRAPYEFLWSTEVEMDGARTLTARAFDSSGNLANSDPVEVTITRPAPSPSPTDEPNPDGPKQVRIGKSWACTTTAAPGDVFAQLALAFVAARLVRRRSK
jgi:poly(hydroxyalkanoate) depolymerase family esterase